VRWLGIGPFWEPAPHLESHARHDDVLPQVSGSDHGTGVVEAANGVLPAIDRNAGKIRGQDSGARHC
jgi:hypothetical protein